LEIPWAGSAENLRQWSDLLPRSINDGSSALGGGAALRFQVDQRRLSRKQTSSAERSEHAMQIQVETYVVAREEF
jgi:hypothetical protein